VTLGTRGRAEKLVWNAGVERTRPQQGLIPVRHAYRPEPLRQGPPVSKTAFVTLGTMSCINLKGVQCALLDRTSPHQGVIPVTHALGYQPRSEGVTVWKTAFVALGTRG
jgi:hypothetical protein